MLLRSLAVPLLSLGLVGLSASAPSGTDKAPSGGGGNPVLVELFTSQGCSSCPPADRVLSRLGLDEATRGTVVPLAFHVDYWNEGGWIDPFSAREWTARQEAYQRALDSDGAYTPQMVVNGRAHFPGGDDRAAREAVVTPAAPAKAHLRLEARRRAGASALDLDVTLDVREPIDARRLDLVLAVYENHLVTDVTGGENRGRTLLDDFVVRRLQRIETLSPTPGLHEQRTVSVALDRAWKAENVGLAVFLQDPRTMAIHGAAALPAGF